MKVLTKQETINYLLEKDYNYYSKHLKSYSNNPKYRGMEKKETQADYAAKHNIYIELSDGVFKLTDERKPSIKSTMYYNDNYDDPGKAYNTFKHYNTRFNKLYIMLEENHQLYINNYDVITYHLGAYYDNDFKRELTQEETDFIKDYIKNVYMVDFEKRLTNYYKKYNDYIYTMGYWADR